MQLQFDFINKGSKFIKFTKRGYAGTVATLPLVIRQAVTMIMVIGNNDHKGIKVKEQVLFGHFPRPSSDTSRQIKVSQLFSSCETLKWFLFFMRKKKMNVTLIF